MVNRKFSSILLGFLFVVNSIINLSALSQDEKIKRNGLVGDYQGHAIPNQKQLGGGAWINLRKLRLEGRKMTAVAAHEANGKEQAMVHNNERTTLKISGKSNEVSLKPLQGVHFQDRHQDKTNMLHERTPLKPDRSREPTLFSNFEPRLQSQDLQPVQTKTSRLKKTNPSSFANVKKVSDQDCQNDDLCNNEDGTNIETQRLLLATKEIFNFMRRDYRGMGRRKPPINNQEPRN